MAFIKNEYARGIGVRELADHLNITRSYLYTIFMNELNISPKDFLKKYRVTRARELLSLTDLSVEAIGKSCGYGNSERFARVFKQENGLTPTQFRKLDRNRSRRNLEMSKTDVYKRQDDILDNLFDKIRKALDMNRMGYSSDEVLDLLMISKYYERIGDHATNIGEWAEFAVRCV